MAAEYGELESTVKRQAERLKGAASRKLDQQFTGRLSSGAAARQKAKAIVDIDVGTQDQLAKLGYEQAAKEREERLIKEGQQYQTSERLGQQEFVGGESEKGRAFQTSERLGSQSFAGDEAQRNRGFAREERLGTQDFQREQSSLDRQLQQMNVNLGYEQLRTQQQQFASEFEENVRTGLFNKIVALKDIPESSLNKILEALGYKGAAQAEAKKYLGDQTGIPQVSTQVPRQVSGGTNLFDNKYYRAV